MSHAVDAVVVGAGIAGLVATSVLHEQGARVVCLEGRDRVGGRAWSEHRGLEPRPVHGGDAPGEPTTSWYYGTPLLRLPHLDGRLVFGSTETAPAFPGYLEGAVLAGGARRARSSSSRRHSRRRAERDQPEAWSRPPPASSLLAASASPAAAAAG